jgi:hypothetical protein
VVVPQFATLSEYLWHFSRRKSSARGLSFRRLPRSSRYVLVDDDRGGEGGGVAEERSKAVSSVGQGGAGRRQGGGTAEGREGTAGDDRSRMGKEVRGIFRDLEGILLSISLLEEVCGVLA